MVVVWIITIIIGIICAVAAGDIEKSVNRDQRADSAYIAAVFAAILGLGAVFAVIASIIALYYIRSELYELEDYSKIRVQLYYNPTISNVINPATIPTEPYTVVNVVAPANDKDIQIAKLQQQIALLQQIKYLFKMI